MRSTTQEAEAMTQTLRDAADPSSRQISYEAAIAELAAALEQVGAIPDAAEAVAGLCWYGPDYDRTVRGLVADALYFWNRAERDSRPEFADADRAQAGYWLGHAIGRTHTVRMQRIEARTARMAAAIA